MKSSFTQPDKDQELKEQIADLVRKHKKRYGYRKITLELRKLSQLKKINHKKVYRIMKELGLLSEIRRKKYRSYKGTVGKVARNRLKRNFTAANPNQKWVTDITEFKVCGRKIYLSPIMDLYDRSIITYTYGFSPDVKLVTDMLDKALPNKRYRKMMIHSDQGFHYQNTQYQKRLKDKNIKQSMSRKGNCLDNSVMEYFFGVIKTEFYRRKKFESVEEFIQGLSEYIDYYNSDRIMCKLKGMSPVEYRNHSLCLN